MRSLRKVVREALRLAPRGLPLFLLLLSACAHAAPLEATLAELQEKKLWRAEAETYAPDEYRAYRSGLRAAKDLLIATERRLPGFRDWDAVAQRYQDVMASGDRVFELVRERRERQADEIAKRYEELRDKIDRLDTLTTLISVGKASREFLTKAELLACEAGALADKGQLGEAAERIKRATAFAQTAKEVIAPALRRFVDQDQITTWRTRVAETIRESKVRGGYAIVVSKVDRRLTLYRAGRPVKTYDVGLGSGSIRDKICAGDRATPEGKYRVIKKVPQSRYYKALLINYPNEDDQRQFAAAKRNGQIPRRAGIGGLIEIHGGGREGMTLGCVALDDRHMDELYALADVGTPVTIVGATDYENTVTLALKGL